MSDIFQRALRDKFFSHMMRHLHRGEEYGDAMRLAAGEVRWQINGGRLDLIELLIATAWHDVHQAYLSQRVPQNGEKQH